MKREQRQIWSGSMAGRPWSTPFRACALRPLDDDNIRCRLASRADHRALCVRWADEWGEFPDLHRILSRPGLAAGDIVVMDNLASHKVKGVKEAIEQAAR